MLSIHIISKSSDETDLDCTTSMHYKSGAEIHKCLELDQLIMTEEAIQRENPTAHHSERWQLHVLSTVKRVWDRNEFLVNCCILWRRFGWFPRLKSIRRRLPATLDTTVAGLLNNFESRLRSSASNECVTFSSSSEGELNWRKIDLTFNDKHVCKNNYDDNCTQGNDDS